MPREPEAFSERVAKLVEMVQPEGEITLTGALELLINGRRLDLENLYRMVQRDPGRGVEIVEHFLDHLLEGESDSAAPLPFELAKHRIMPRIQPAALLQHLDPDLAVHIPFVNDSIIIYVIDMPHITVSITVEQMIKWGIDIDEIDRIARENLKTLTPKLELRLLEAENGGKAIMIAEQDGYDASRLLLSNLFDNFAPELGGNFYVAAPSRDAFLALTTDPQEFVDQVMERVAIDFKRLPYPVSERFFLVTRDGIAGTEDLVDEGEAAA